MKQDGLFFCDLACVKANVWMGLLPPWTGQTVFIDNTVIQPIAKIFSGTNMRWLWKQGLSAMRRDEESILSYVTKKVGKTRHVTLIDPDKQTPEIAAKRACIAVEAGSEMIFVGGSTDTPD